jgi:hypothetical protein
MAFHGGFGHARTTTASSPKAKTSSGDDQVEAARAQEVAAIPAVEAESAHGTIQAHGEPSGESGSAAAARASKQQGASEEARRAEHVAAQLGPLTPAWL